jgi:hypothetical protein
VGTICPSFSGSVDHHGSAHLAKAVSKKPIIIMEHLKKRPFAKHEFSAPHLL